MGGAIQIVGWIVLGPPIASLITLIAGRLLGARRGWVMLVVSGIIGFAGALLAAGAVTGWEWGSVEMVLVTMLLGTIFTMSVALAFDLVAPVGTLARGEAAGLITLRNPVAGVRRSLRPVRRYHEVLRLARTNGVVARRVSHETLPAGVRRTLEQAGGIFVKLGQVASTRTDVLPRAWCDELASLRSAAAPAPAELMRPMVATSLGDEPERIFASFEWTPMASASISQVYRAQLHDSTDVVVKVQRPGLDETVELDGAAVMQLARLIERRTPLGLSVRPAELAAEFLDNVREELDFSIEASNGRELATALAGIERVRVPATFPELSGRRILVQELVTAPSIDELLHLGVTAHDRRDLADRLVGIFVQQLFHVGVFHADPHPGNILVEPDGTIVMIDLGAVGRLGPGHRSAVLEMLASASVGEASGLRQALSRITVFDRRVDVHALDDAIESLLVRHLRSGGGITAAAFEDLAVLIGRFGIRLPRWFGTLSRAMVCLEGTLTSLDPSFSLIDAAQSHARDAAAVPGADAGWRSVVEREAMRQLPRLRRIPERVDEVLGQVVGGRLSARLSLFADERDERLVTRLVNRMVLALVASAQGIGSVLLLRVGTGPIFDDSVTINEVIGYFGLASAAILTLRVIAGVVRDGET